MKVVGAIVRSRVGLLIGIVVVVAAVVGLMGMSLVLGESRQHSGPGVCVTQLVIMYETDEQMNADEQRIREHDDVASATPQTQRQVYEWYLAQFADEGKSELAKLLHVAAFTPRMWVAADGVGIDDLADRLSRDLNKSRDEFVQKSPCSDAKSATAAEFVALHAGPPEGQEPSDHRVVRFAVDLPERWA